MILDIERIKKDEFHIDNVIFIDFDINRIKSFFKSQPTEKEIENFIPKLSKPIGNMKVINFLNGRTNLSKNNSDYSKIYYSLLNDYNKELFDRIEKISRNDITLTICPNKEWSERLFGNPEQLQDLWIKINKGKNITQE